MSYSILLDQLIKQAQSTKQLQRMIMSHEMQQAIQVLQMPVQELELLLEKELLLNPVLEEENDLSAEEEDESKESTISLKEDEKELDFSEYDFEILKKIDEEFKDSYSDYDPIASPDEEKRKAFLETSISETKSLFSELLLQAQEKLATEKEIKMAEQIIGNFDENGFLTTSLNEIAILNQFSVTELEVVLQIIQTFDPPGVGAKNVQESLLLQLLRKKKKNSLAYQIINQHYDDLLNNRIPLIAKSLGVTSDEITDSVKRDVSVLDLHPGFGHFEQIVFYIKPDATIEEENGQLLITIHDDIIPDIKINRHYLKLLTDEESPKEVKDFIKEKIASAKWLIKNVHQRHETLHKIIEILVEIQADYFSKLDGEMIPLTMKIVAEKLSLHESTIARAISNKYIQCIKGLKPLRSFFTSALNTSLGEEISSSTAKAMLKKIIESENKNKPLSDTILSKMLQAEGIACARRTVAKYRQALKFGNAQQRKRY